MATEPPPGGPPPPPPSPNNKKKDEAKKGGRRLQHLRGLGFPMVLHVLLTDAENSRRSNVISWIFQGTAFMVHNREVFVRDFMPRYFRTGRYKSFQRSLRLWGFDTVRSGSHKGAVSHRFFRRDQLALCSRILRVPVRSEYEGPPLSDDDNDDDHHNSHHPAGQLPLHSPEVGNATARATISHLSLARVGTNASSEDRRRIETPGQGIVGQSSSSSSGSQHEQVRPPVPGRSLLEPSSGSSASSLLAQLASQLASATPPARQEPPPSHTRSNPNSTGTNLLLQQAILNQVSSLHDQTPMVDNIATTALMNPLQGYNPLLVAGILSELLRPTADPASYFNPNYLTVLLASAMATSSLQQAINQNHNESTGQARGHTTSSSAKQRQDDITGAPQQSAVTNYPENDESTMAPVAANSPGPVGGGVASASSATDLSSLVISLLAQVPVVAPQASTTSPALLAAAARTPPQNTPGISNLNQDDLLVQAIVNALSQDNQSRAPQLPPTSLYPPGTNIALSDASANNSSTMVSQLLLLLSHIRASRNDTSESPWRLY